MECLCLHLLLPIWQGNSDQLLNWFSTHVISSSIYYGAGTFNGVFTFCPSAQRYSNFCPALITGQESLVQNSVKVPYKMEISLQNSIALTASHQLRSYPDGNSTARDMLPLPKVICAICLRCIYFELFYMGLIFFMGFIFIIQIQTEYIQKMPKLKLKLNQKMVASKRQMDVCLYMIILKDLFLILELTYNFIGSMSEKFQFLGKIGEGAFATVYKVKRIEDSNLYAFKKMKALKMTDRQLSNSLNEIRILASINNPYIISYKQAFYDSTLKSFCLVTQFADGGDLSHKISLARKNKAVISEQYIWKLVLQLLHGIKHLHAMKIFHRDIKPANILLTKNDESGKLADLNVSVISKTGMASTQTGTPAYASPQVWMQKPYSGKSDIWSLGCVIYELATLRPPFTGTDLQNLRKNIIYSDFQAVPSSYSKQLHALIKICLQKDQKIRPGATQLLNLPIIKEKMKEFPHEKFNQPYFPSIERTSNMINTIRVENGNFKSLQNKLPKCNYNAKDKQNEGISSNNSRVLQNNSQVSKALSKNQNQNQKLPNIKRPDSASKINDLANRIEIIKKLRS